MFHNEHRQKWEAIRAHRGRLQRQPPSRSSDVVSGDHALEDLLRTLRDERGFASATLRNRQRMVGPFLAWLTARGRPWQDTQARGRDRVPGQPCRVEPRDDRLSRAVAAHFFRHAAERGWCRPHLAEQIEAPRLYTHERLPQGPPWRDVQQLLEAQRGDTPRQMRNHAMLLLLAVYGFRSSEVRGLTLDDLDWAHDIIRPPRPKQRKVGHVPAGPRGRRRHHRLSSARASHVRVP